MAKEVLTTENIKEDLLRVVEFKRNNISEWRFNLIFPMTLLAILLGYLLKNVWIGILIFSVAVYHIVRYVIETKETIKLKNILKGEITRGDFSISEEEFSHISEEIIYDPHRSGQRTRKTRTIKVLHFKGGRSWRIYYIGKHYKWSKQYSMSSSGLENTSVSGNSFYFVTLKCDEEIAYVYNTKFFDLRK